MIRDSINFVKSQITVFFQFVAISNHIHENLLYVPVSVHSRLSFGMYITLEMLV